MASIVDDEEGAVCGGEDILNPREQSIVFCLHRDLVNTADEAHVLQIGKQVDDVFSSLRGIDGKNRIGSVGSSEGLLRRGRLGKQRESSEEGKDSEEHGAPVFWGGL